MISIVRSQDNLNSIGTAFNKHNESTLTEKLFVHTDKSFYVAGEILWFKIYCVDAGSHTPLNLSKVAYVEILDSVNKNILQAKISLNNATGSGSFYLPLNTSSGNFKLRAYTKWMRNFGPQYFFEKNITIVNVQKDIPNTAHHSIRAFDIQFFPEGGNLVNNVASKIAFKGTDQYGKSMGFRGLLVDNKDTVLSFEPLHAGMGTFTFTPMVNHAYKAIIQTDSGQTIVKALPEIYNSGYVMSLSESGDKITVTVEADKSQNGQVYLFAHSIQAIKVAEQGSIINGKAVFIFEKAKLGDGITHITIFNDQRQPVCERLYFKKPGEELEIKINTDQQTYSSRKKVSININVGDAKEKNDTASLSMSVFRIDSLQSLDAPPINAYLFLTSDLGGNVEDADFYFRNDNAETNMALDLLMLTNGWRRFKWDEILKNKKSYFEFPPEYNGPIVLGKVTNIETGKPAANIDTYVSIPGFQNGFGTSQSDEKGLIKFEENDFYGISEMILQPNSKEATYHIEVIDPFSNNYSNRPLPAFSLPAATEKSLLSQSISMQVQNIFSGKKLKQFADLKFDTTSFYLHPDEKYFLDDYKRFTTLEEILREYVIMADVRKRDGDFHFLLYDFANNMGFRNDPLVMLDGVPVIDFNKFMELDPLNLYKLEVLNRRYFLGNAVFNGVLNWTSYKGDLAGYDPGANATVIDYEGLQKEREFYSPSYETTEQLSSHIPDFRNVLQWSPDININPGDMKQINFYSSDLPGKYMVQVQGITKTGLAGSRTFTFEVKR